MGEGERFQLGTIGALTLSVVSSVSIVICNKALMSSLHFIFGKLKKFPFELLQRKFVNSCAFFSYAFWYFVSIISF